MNRNEILQKLAAGEISVQQATQLLAGEQGRAAEPDGGGGEDTPEPHMKEGVAEDSIDESDAAHGEAPSSRPSVHDQPKRKNGARRLHIEVTDGRTNRNRVRINVPIGLVRAGVWMGNKFAKGVDREAWQAIMDSIDNDEIGTLVEVDDADSGERVHIYID